MNETNAMLLGGSSASPPTPVPLDYYPIKSLRFVNQNSTRAMRVVAYPSSSYKRGLISVWCKRSQIGASYPQHLYQSCWPNSPYRNYSVAFGPDDSLEVKFGYQTAPNSSWNFQAHLVTAAKFRDTTGWTHFYISWDTTHPIESERVRIIVNLKRITNFSTEVYPQLNEAFLIDTVGYSNFIGDTEGKGIFTDGWAFDGYLAEYNRVDGHVIEADHFGEMSELGNWKARPSNLEPWENVDIHFPNVSLLICADENLYVRDMSDLGHPINIVGDPAYASMAPFGDDTGSLLLPGGFGDGSSDCLYVNHHPSLSLVGVNFTLEAMIYPYVHTGQILGKDGVFGSSYLQYGLRIGSDGRLKGSLGNGNGVNPTETTYSGNDIIELSAWNHVAMCADQDTCYGFLNGVLQWSAPRGAMYEGGKPLHIGYQPGSDAYSYFNGRISQVRITRTITRYTETFPMFTRTWARCQDKHGVNGFRLEFSGENGDMFEDSADHKYAGNSIRWSSQNFDFASDSVLDSPPGFFGNLNTMNPRSGLTDYKVFLNAGNLQATVPSTFNSQDMGSVMSSFPLKDGQYFEITILSAASGAEYDMWAGVCKGMYSPLSGFVGISNRSSFQKGLSGFIGATEFNLYPIDWEERDVVGFCYRNGEVWVHINGVWELGDTEDYAAQTYTKPFVDDVYACFMGRDYGNSVKFNFGQTPFSFPPPAGFGRVGVRQWAVPEITGPDLANGSSSYTGDGTNNRQLQLLPIHDDITWFKSASNSGDHVMFCRLRGSDEPLRMNTADAEDDVAGLHTFLTDGWHRISYETSEGPSSDLNEPGNVYKVWGLVTGSNVGVDITLYEGIGAGNENLVQHHLLAPPELTIIKPLNAVGGWQVETTVNGSMEVGFLNQSTPFQASPNPPPDTSYLLRIDSLNEALVIYQALSFRSVLGYSKIGQYTGRSVSGAPAVYCGFRPSMVLIKKMTGSNADWYLLDADKDSSSPIVSSLSPNTTAPVTFGESVDFTATGFVVRSSDSSFNSFGERYLFMAFASVPTKYALSS